MADFFDQLEDVDPYWTQQNMLDGPYVPSDAYPNDVKMHSSPPRTLSPFQPVPNEDFGVERPLLVSSEPPQVHDQDEDQDEMDLSFDPLGDELNAAIMNQVPTSDDNLATSSTIRDSPHERVRSPEGIDSLMKPSWNLHIWIPVRCQTRPLY